TCTWPARRSVSAGVVPRYGTWIMSIPVMNLNSSPATWCTDPMPAEAMLTLPGLDLGESNEFRNGLGRNRRIDLHDLRHAEDACDRRDVAKKHEAELVVERCVDRVRRDDQQERMPVRGRAHDCFGGYISAGPRTVLDHERLTETLRQPLSQQARGNV